MYYEYPNGSIDKNQAKTYDHDGSHNKMKAGYIPANPVALT